ncbi:MAG: hypothetical protein Q9183_003520 [Haloplaca sp. 2 TL-2023]
MSDIFERALNNLENALITWPYLNEGERWKLIPFCERNLAAMRKELRPTLQSTPFNEIQLDFLKDSLLPPLARVAALRAKVGLLHQPAGELLDGFDKVVGLILDFVTDRQNRQDWIREVS